jgi:hypothetical protein
MDNFAVRKAREIEPPIRQWIERLFGRSLKEDENLAFFVTSPEDVPPEKARKAAFQRLGKILDKAATNMNDVSRAEVDQAVDDAIHHIRKRTT